MNLITSFNFLLELQFNNNRQWFKENEDLYKNAKSEFDTFTSRLIAGLQKIDPEIEDLSPKDCTFRIYRDVRFSKDKEPYKNNMGAFISKGGKKSPFAGYYIHLEPGGSFVGGGIYMPEKNILDKIRKSIFQNPSQLKKILNQKEFKSYFTEIYGEKLKTAPKGFPKDFKDIDLLRHKHYALAHSLKDDFWKNNNVDTEILKVFSVMKEFNDFFNSLISI
jgi:uncharacterized protein (TIGR02453 family)